MPTQIPYGYREIGRDEKIRVGDFWSRSILGHEKLAILGGPWIGNTLNQIDEKIIRPIDVGEGYELVKVGEATQWGDEVFVSDEWLSAAPRVSITDRTSPIRRRKSTPTHAALRELRDRIDAMIHAEEAKP